MALFIYAQDHMVIRYEVWVGYERIGDWNKSWNAGTCGPPPHNLW
jgi:hypothetical protein